MQPPETQQTPQQTLQQPSSDAQDPAECYAQRRRRALQLTVSLFALSLVVLVVGLVCATRTDNVAVAGYYPGVIVIDFRSVPRPHWAAPPGEQTAHGEFYLVQLIAAIIFISLGVIAAFFCAIIDGIIAGKYIDSQPLVDGSCDFYSSALGFVYDTYYTEITCPSHYSSGCKLKISSNTCYCCYSCGSSYYDQYQIFTGVSSCWDVIYLHRLLWVSVVLNILAVCLGIISAALLGAYKDLPKPSLHVTPSTAPFPHILYNPTQHMMTYPLQHYPTHPVLHTPQFHPDGTPASACPSDQSRGPGLPPPHPPNLSPPQEGGHPDLYTLTPDAPVLYAAAYAPFVKPPPYAY
ncbi:unnamed protein product [Lota lota]